VSRHATRPTQGALEAERPKVNIGAGLMVHLGAGLKEHLGVGLQVHLGAGCRVQGATPRSREVGRPTPLKLTDFLEVDPLPSS